MKKVALIGDSIRLGYQADVKERLAGIAEISSPAENCRFSAYTLFNLATWVPDADYDVIQWNNGQWDTCYMPDGKRHTPLPMYLELQVRIARILLQKTRRLIFATTTPVWPEQFASGAVHPRKNEDIQAYNRAAIDALTPLGIGINDLNTPVATDIKRYISADMVHMTEAGNALCVDLVSAAIAG